MAIPVAIHMGLPLGDAPASELPAIQMAILWQGVAPPLGKAPASGLPSILLVILLATPMAFHVVAHPRCEALASELPGIPMAISMAIPPGWPPPCVRFLRRQRY